MPLVPKVRLSLPKTVYTAGESITATISDRDPARFYTWGWGMSNPVGEGFGTTIESPAPIPASTTTLTVPYNTTARADWLAKYGQFSVGVTIDEWTADPGSTPNYNSPTYVGPYNVSATVYPAGATVPTITSASLAEGTPSVTAAAIGRYVQGVSRLSWSINASSAAGIASYEITIDGTTYRSQTGTSGVLMNSGTRTVTTKVTDYAGNTQTRTDSIVVLAYTPPKITAFNAFRSTSGGAASETGTYVRATFTGTAASLVNGTQKNSTSWVIKTRVLNGTFANKGSGTSALAPSGTITPSGYDVNTSYEVRLELSDKLSTVAAVTYISKGGVVLDLGPGTVGIGKDWARGPLDVGGDGFFDGTVTATGLDLGAGPVQAGSVDATSLTQGGNNVVDTSLTSTTSRRGLIEIATQAEVDAGTDTARAVTPATLKASLELPAPLVDRGDSAFSFTFPAGSWGNIAGSTALTFGVLERPLMVEIRVEGIGGTTTGSSYAMLGAGCRGGLDLDPQVDQATGLQTFQGCPFTNIPDTSVGYNNPMSGTKIVTIPAGPLTDIRLWARRSAAIGTQRINYSSIIVTPIRWM